jgi:predicted dehydrogenase
MSVPIAFLGLAHVHAHDHLDLIRRRGDLELVAVCPAGDGLVAEVATDLLVDDPAVAADMADLVVVDSPIDRHLELTRLVAEIGRPVFVEKPIGPSLAAAERLAVVVRGADVGFGTGFYFRELPALRRLRRLFREGELGELRSVEGSLGHDGLAQGVFTGAAAWRVDRDRAGVGALGDLGSHLLDWLLWLRPEKSLAVEACRVTRDPDVEVEVAGEVELLWDDGVPAHLGASWTERPGGFRLVLTGTEGTAAVSGGRLTVTGANPSGFKGPDPAAEDALEGFIDSLSGTRDPEAPTLAGSLEVARLLDAAYGAATHAE